MFSKVSHRALSERKNPITTNCRLLFSLSTTPLFSGRLPLLYLKNNSYLSKLPRHYPTVSRVFGSSIVRSMIPINLSLYAIKTIKPKTRQRLPCQVQCDTRRSGSIGSYNMPLLLSYNRSYTAKRSILLIAKSIYHSKTATFPQIMTLSRSSQHHHSHLQVSEQQLLSSCRNKYIPAVGAAQDAIWTTRGKTRAGSEC